MIALRALITGSTHGIGRATALALLDRGWKVFGIDREPSSLSHLNYTHTELDLCGEEALEVVSNLVRVAMPTLTVHCAGRGIIRPFGESSRTEDGTLLALNVGATYLITKIFVQSVLQRKEPQHLILLSSLAGLTSTPGMALYAASKHFVSGLAKSVQAELAVDAPWAKLSSLAPPPVRTSFREHSGRPTRNRPIRGVLDVDVVVSELLRLIDEPKLDRIPGRLQRWAFKYVRPLIPRDLLLRKVYLSAKSE